jgi:hypothetical protein
MCVENMAKKHTTFVFYKKKNKKQKQTKQTKKPMM